MNDNIAWEHLTPTAIMVLLHYRPDLRDEYEESQRKETERKLQENIEKLEG